MIKKKINNNLKIIFISNTPFRETQHTDFITLKLQLMTYERGAERRPIKAMTFQ